MIRCVYCGCCFDDMAGWGVCRHCAKELEFNFIYNKKEKEMNKTKAAVRFVCNGDGTVTDNLTGLTWIKDPSELGKVWGTPGSPSRMNYYDAVKNCKGLKFAGHKDWRLPTIKELQSLIDYEKRNPAINTEFFPKTQSSWYWSITLVAGCSSYAWVVLFSDGDVGSGGKGFDFYVRPVRSSQ